MSLREKFQGGTLDHFDWALFIATLIIVLVGVINLMSATSVYQQARAELPVTQVMFLMLGGASAVVMMVIDYRQFERFAYLLYGFGITSLLVVLALGKGIRGSSRWINIGPFGFQPSEFTKIWLTLALAKYFHDAPRSDQPKYLRELAIPALIAGVPFLLVYKQPDLGTALIHGLIFISIVALQRIRWTSVLLLVTTLVGGTYAIYKGDFLHDYQKARITSFLDPESDITGTNYHAHNARIAIGNGGLFGQGYQLGTQNQYHFLPDQYTDFPFPVLAEEWGFVGCFLLLLVYAFVVLWAVKIASQARDRFAAITAIGVGGMIFWHVIFNVGMVTGLLPVVGVVLPLFSYGGSSVVTMLMGVGLLMNISMRRVQLTPVRSSYAILSR